jgi:type VI secretion system protein ImpJ
MPRKLVWTEGLFVTQHHFQQQDRYHEQLLQDRLSAALPFEWGITDVEIDERALSAGQVKISRLNGVLPGGMPISVGDGTDDQVPIRAIEGAFTAQMRSLEVHVAIAQTNDTQANVELEGKPGALTRYVRQQASVFDVNSGMQESSIAWARSNLRILFGEERREAFDAIRVCELVRAGTGAVVLKETHVPPVLQIRASPFILAGFRRLLGAMTARQRSLAEGRRMRTAAAIDFAASDAAKFWLLNALNTFIPIFSHIVDQSTTHPESAYLALSQLIGTLCTFAVDGDPTKIPKFNYLQLGEVFGPMFDLAMALLNAVILERYVQIPLQKREDGMYLGKMEDPKVLRYEFYLAASGTVPEAQVRDRLPKLLKIASWNQIGAILNSAINGAKIDLEYRPPGALPIKPGVTFFKVIRTPDFWGDIAGTGTIALYQPVDPNALTLSLYAVDPANLE